MKIYQVIDEENEEVGLYSYPKEMNPEIAAYLIRHYHLICDQEDADEELEKHQILRNFTETIQL